MDKQTTILYEDAGLIVCHKPAGVPVQSAKIGQKDMVSILNNYLAEKKGSSEKFSPAYVVHRLDQPVEGVLVFAKTKCMAADLSKQIADGSMKKIYRAVCCCAENKRSGMKRPKLEHSQNTSENHAEYILVDYLLRDGRRNTSSVVKQSCQNAKRAELSFCIKEVLQRQSNAAEKGAEISGFCTGDKKEYCLVEIKLKTGRHHQIRVQMAHAGMPLYGDQKYNENWREFLTETDRIRLSGQNAGKIFPALCAVSLTFVHPETGKKMVIETEPEADVFSLFPHL